MNATNYDHLRETCEAGIVYVCVSIAQFIDYFNLLFLLAVSGGRCVWVFFKTVRVELVVLFFYCELTLRTRRASRRKMERFACHSGQPLLVNISSSNLDNQTTRKASQSANTLRLDCLN